MGSSQTQQQQSSTPWAPQSAALQTAFTDAGGALTQAQGAKAPTDFTAQFTPDQLVTFKSMFGYGSGSNPNQQATSNTGTALSTAGTNATEGALSGLGAYDPTKTNNTGSLVDAANQYVAGQNIPAQVRQAMQLGTETARDVTLPQIEQNAAINGNTNSSRTGIADGLVQRGLAENASNMTGALSSQAFANGLNLASNNANANNANTLGALTGAAGAGTSAANSGTNANTSAINDQGNLYTLAGEGGSGEQQANQAQLTNEQQQYQSQVSSPFDAINKYMGVVGANNWGSNTTGTQTTTPSAWQVIGGLLGGAGSAASMAGGLGWKPLG